MTTVHVPVFVRRDPFFLGAVIALSIVIGFSIGVGAGRSIEAYASRSAQLVSTSERAPGLWRFQPQADMTPAEAALVIVIGMRGPDIDPDTARRIEALPPAIRRHFAPPVTNGQESVK